MSDLTLWSGLRETIIFKHWEYSNNRNPHSLCSIFLSLSDSDVCLLGFAFLCAATPASFLLTLYVFLNPESLYASPHQSLCLTCFHTTFSLLALGIPTVESSVCFIWVWKLCANIACLYPLGRIMAAITHWCITKTDILLSLSWQTAYSSHCSLIPWVFSLPRSLLLAFYCHHLSSSFSVFISS